MKNAAILVIGSLILIVAGCSGGKVDSLKFESFTVASGEQTTALHFTDSDGGFVVAASGIIYRTTDGGKSFSQVGSSSGRRLNDVYFIDSDNGFACGNSGTLLRTTDAGSTWSPIAADTNVDFTGIAFPDDESGVIAGNVVSGDKSGFGVIGTSTDEGATWKFQTTEQRAFTRVDVVPYDHAWILGQESLNYTTDRGKSWEHSASRVPGVNYLLFTDVQHGWEVGDHGLLRHSTDGGWSWQEKLKLTESNLTCLAAPEPGHIYVAGDNFLGVSANFARNWTVDEVTHKINFVDIHSVGHDVFVLGSKGEIIKLSY